MNITVKIFEELTLKELYNLLKLRFQVFVVEQQSIYNEYDDIDFIATHFFIYDDSQMVAYLRLYEKSSNTLSFGRVIVEQNYRRKGLSREMIQFVIDFTRTKKNIKKIEIQAQVYLSDFYKSFGFNQVSNSYDDGGVPHIDMELVFWFTNIYSFKISSDGASLYHNYSN